MNENGQKLTALVAALLLVATVLGNILGSRDKLDTSRPGQTGSEPYPTLGSQRIPARLWQDPFEALRTATNAPADSSDADDTSPAAAGTAWSSLVSPPLSGSLARFTNAEMKLNVLGVLLESAPYPEDAEVRRRLRYAVQAALLSSDVTPVDRNHIGVATLRRIDPRPYSPYVTNLALAFEWFESRTSVLTNSYLVLWLKEEDFSGAPLRMCVQVVKALQPKESTDLKFWMIGPRASDTLRALAEEIPLLERDDVTILKSHVNILSPEATAPDSALLPQATNSPDRAALASKLNDRLGLTNRSLFHNWIATDGELCTRIVEELRLRRVLPKLETDDKIVLLSEGDTFYGRSLPVVFANSLKRVCGDGVSNNLVLFNYLRGLEGIKPLSEEPNEPSSADPQTPEKILQDALRESGEKAEGQSQKDYAQRLASLLARRDVELRRRLGGIRAVGLMGNDVYDKLVLLKAIRRQLPNTLFFTTDLDTRLWMPPEHLIQTRNLVVASAYPIEPQGPSDHYLPFRDVYQAAVFAACRGLATGEPRPPTTNLHGKIFEIGRNGPVELLQAATSPGSGAATVRVGAFLRRTFWARAIVGALIGVGFTTYFAAVLLGRFRPSSHSKPAPDAACVSPSRLLCRAILILGFLLATGCLAYWISQKPGEEPMTFTDSVSIWCSEGIRLAAVGLSLFSLITACHRSKAQCAKLSNSFFKDTTVAPAENASPVPSKKSLKQWIQEMSINRWEAPITDRKRVDAAQLFHGYEQRRLHHGPCFRVLGMASLYLGLVIGVVLIGGPPARICVRGDFSRWFDSALLLISVLLFLAVLFYALDAARLSGKMLRSLAEKRTEWPPWLKKKRASERSFREEDLAGLLDMEFAVEVTCETRRLMFFPFLIFLLLWIARSKLFENWTWSPSLIAVFFLNFAVAAVCWWLVRDAAQHVRKTALDQLKETVNQLEGSQETTIAAPADSAVSWSFTKRRYLKRLRKLMDEIKQERRAAFANCIQDPTYAVMLIPTGVTGIITILATQLLHR